MKQPHEFLLSSLKFMRGLVDAGKRAYFGVCDGVVFWCDMKQPHEFLLVSLKFMRGLVDAGKRAYFGVCGAAVFGHNFCLRGTDSRCRAVVVRCEI